MEDKNNCQHDFIENVDKQIFICSKCKCPRSFYQAAQYYKHQLSELQRESEWVSVDDQPLPSEGQFLAKTSGGDTHLVHWKNNRLMVFNHFSLETDPSTDSGNGYLVVAWCPFVPPKEG